MAVIQIEHLQKNYGRHVGIRDVTFSVQQGEIFGFVGPNGAGKSTTIKVLLGLIFPGGGQASICGLDVVKNSKEIKSFTGYVPSDVRLYRGMRIRELLAINQGFYLNSDHEETERLVSLFDLDTSKRFHELSAGNKKKVSLVCALMAKPKVIILDEPTSGLDPVIQKTLFSELERQTAKGATVLLSSHNLAEVQEYCQRVAFIKDGSILAITDLSGVLSRHKVVRVTGGNTSVPDSFTLMKTEGLTRVFRTELSGGDLLEALTALAPLDFTVEHESMEQHFWDLYEGANDR